ncbi:LysR family transcriptional regulator [Pigmentiphaga aceris]|uniref:LysR family transcriptional regulator n=1 Tax=Pigmentiphaga aceris TaxID=1940612 RepID=A0A5C0B0D9_9BURK|nr:LysR family transcriptional regulator [Pigmentiphaga aceris]QEI07163.1 LysR family transcriptional regulator [Pigmentiphaga aceris]
MLSRRELKLLRAMHTLGTVTAAAASIDMTQPAASAMLKDLEIRLGVALFSREKRRLRMTAQGRTLMPEVLNALAALESADRLANDMRHGTVARLVIGAVAIAASSLLPAALARVRAAHPSVAVTVRAGTALEIIDMAVEHRVDLGIIIGKVADNHRVTSLTLAPLSLYAVMREDHPWAGRVGLSLTDMADQTIIVLADALPAGSATRAAFDAQGVPYRTMVEVMQSSAACALAAEGLGVAIVESLGAHYATRVGLVAHKLVALENSALTLVWAPGHVLSAPAICFRDGVLEKVAANM